MSNDVHAPFPAAIHLDLAAIARACERHHVARLSLFGSVLTDRFDPDRSDVDLLVEFAPNAERTFHALFALQDELEQIVGRPVDLVQTRNLRNPYLIKSITSSARDLYAA